MQAKKTIIFVVVALMLASMACAGIPSGEIISAEDATRTAKPTATTELNELVGAKFSVGDTAVIIGGRFGALVPLFGNPGDAFFSSQVLNGTVVTVLGIQQLGDVIWYRVEGMTGEGWLIEENLVTEAEQADIQAERAGGTPTSAPDGTPQAETTPEG